MSCAGLPSCFSLARPKKSDLPHGLVCTDSKDKRAGPTAVPSDRTTKDGAHLLRDSLAARCLL